MATKTQVRHSSESALTFDELVVDPYHSTDNNEELAEVWERCDELKRLIDAKDKYPSTNDRFTLKLHLLTQLDTLFVYWKMAAWAHLNAHAEATTTNATVYILLFPGEASDNTGIKDLNDKVLGYFLNSQFIKLRQQAIKEVFEDDKKIFEVAGNTYKTATIFTIDGDQKEFTKRMISLDVRLREALMQVLELAQKAPLEPAKKKAAQKLWNRLNKRKKYPFELFFGLRKLELGRDSLENTYLLITEALKGAALARFISKGTTLQQAAAKKFVKGFVPKKKKNKPRGKEYVWQVFMKALDQAEKLKAFILGGPTLDSQFDFRPVYIDTVWTSAFLEHKNLNWGNPDVVRDVRKKLLEPAKLRDGNIVVSFKPQKELLELWLVILNMLDFVKRFDSTEFKKEVLAYHDDSLGAFLQLGTESSEVAWPRLERLLTHDVRQKDAIAVYESASEFQFYCRAADYPERIMFNMDVRDMGVELMLDYEFWGREIGFNQYSDVDLLTATFQATDIVDQRRRQTYADVVSTFQGYYALIAVNLRTAKKAARKAFGAATADIDFMPSFEDSVQIMLGGDEIFVAAHPLFAKYIADIIRDLDRTPRAHPLEASTLDLRTGISFSSAVSDSTNQRRMNQLSHQEAIKLADSSSGALKKLERKHRRIERLIEMLDANPSKATKAPPYRAALNTLGLKKVFGRTKFGDASPLAPKSFSKLIRHLANEDLERAQNTKHHDLVDFDGNVVDSVTLEADAAALEKRVEDDVGTDNTRQQPPPVNKVPKWMEKILDCWEDPNKC